MTSFFFGNMEKKLKEFIEHLNEKQKSIDFLDVTVSFITGQVSTDLYVKPADSCQYLKYVICLNVHQCQYCFHYVDSTKTKFRYRIHNCKSTYRKFRKKYVEKDLAIVIKKHYCSEGHQEIESWSVTLIDQVKDLHSLRKKALYLINSLNTWDPNGPKMDTFLEKTKVLYSHTQKNVF